MHRRPRLPERPIEPYWGDIRDAPLVHRLPYPRRPRERNWLEWSVLVILTVVGLCVAAAMLLVFLAVIFLSGAARAQDYSSEYEKQVRRDCAADALRYCARVIPKGRAAIITCMLANKPKLAPRCARHLY